MEKPLVEKNYQDIEKHIPKQIELLRNVVKDNHNLIIPEHCDKFLARCLRQKDGDLEKAVCLVTAYHKCLNDLQHWNFSIQPSVHEQFFKTWAVAELKDSDPKTGCRINVCRIALWNPKETSFEEALGCLWMAAQYATANFPEVQRKGFIIIWDYTDFSVSHMWAVNHWKLISMSRYLQNGVSGRLTGLHFINHPRAVGLFYKAIKPFLKEKLKNRLHFHDSIKSLHDAISPEVLPTTLGGTQDPELCFDKIGVQKFLKQDEYFHDMMTHKFPAY